LRGARALLDPLCASDIRGESSKTTAAKWSRHCQVHVGRGAVLLESNGLARLGAFTQRHAAQHGRGDDGLGRNAVAAAFLAAAVALPAGVEILCPHYETSLGFIVSRSLCRR
jgi:hypothetical protein